MGLFGDMFKKKKKESTKVRKKQAPLAASPFRPTSISTPTSSIFAYPRRPLSGVRPTSTPKERPTRASRQEVRPVSNSVSKDILAQLRKKRGDSKSRSSKAPSTASLIVDHPQKATSKGPITNVEIRHKKRPISESPAPSSPLNSLKSKSRATPFTSTPKDVKKSKPNKEIKELYPDSRIRSVRDTQISKPDTGSARKKHAQSQTGSTLVSVRKNANNNNNNERRDLNLNKPQIGLLTVPFVISASVSPVLHRKDGQINKRTVEVNPLFIDKEAKGEKNKDGHGQQDNVSRTSSITNLDSLDAHRVHQKSGTKPRKSSSRERVDKIQEKERKYDGKKGVTKNNNKLDAGGNSYSVDSLQEEEVLQLKRQLQEMANEKSNLALQLGEQKGQLNNLQKEILKLKSFQEESNLELEKLSEENTILRNRLRDVAHSPLSDSEKQQLLFESHRHHNSAPASIATNVPEDAGGDTTACTTPDWDKYSSSNVSEVSVACLQDKINQMQETHYSTNEELQATLQELTDLQRQLTELQQENERLIEEKALMFDSLCRQTDRLTDSRQEIESLKQLLYREKDENGQYESAAEREQKLLDLLKSAQEERESLMVKLEQLNGELQELRAGNIEKSEDIIQLSERVKTLECTLDAKHAEHKQLDQELAIAKDQCSGKQIEINRLTDLLETARTKIIELEQDRTLIDKSELDELLDNARKEKDQFESEVTYLKEQLARSKNETEKLKEQVFMLQEECKVTRNNAKTTQSDLEYKCERLLSDKNAVSEQLLQFQDAVSELQVQSQCHLEDKRQLSAVLSETQRNLSEAERRNANLESELQELKKLRDQENEEWEKFQNDLLTSVRVANDFKTEAQQELQKFILENKSYRERVRLLEGQIDKIKSENQAIKEEPTKEDTAITKSVDTTDNNMETIFPELRSKRSRDKPRKSKDSLDSVTSSDKSDKKPDIFSKFVKKRDKKPNRTKCQLSVEEELLLQSLDNWYANIDKNIPEECLTPEEKAVKKLKLLYQEDSQKEKPVAKKPKAELAISKPFLNSVLLNPKLVEIVNDPKVLTIEEQSQKLQYDNNNFFVVRDSQVPSDERYQRVASEDFGKKKRRSYQVHKKSKSLDNLNVFEDKRKTGEINALYRSVEAQNLATNENLELKQAKVNRVSDFSDILPSDSVSNLRYPSTQEVHSPRRKSNITYENLDEIISSIPKDAPEHKLKKEQKFALRLKKALDDAKNKRLRKVKLKDDVEISAPTQDSVENNRKLREIIQNPNIKNADEEKKSQFFISIFQGSDDDEKRHSLGNDVLDNTDNRSHKPLGVTRTASKSYDDINFQFMPQDTLINMYSNDSVVGSKIGKVSHSSSSSVSYTSGEFNVVTGAVSPTCNVSVRGQVEDSGSDLLYNETLSKSGVAKPKDFNQDVIEYSGDPGHEAAKKKFKKQLSQYVEKVDTETKMKNRRFIKEVEDVEGKLKVPVVEEIRLESWQMVDDDDADDEAQSDVVIQCKKPIAQERVHVKKASSEEDKLKEPISVDFGQDYVVQVVGFDDEKKRDQRSSRNMENKVDVNNRFKESRMLHRPVSEEVKYRKPINVDFGHYNFKLERAEIAHIDDTSSTLEDRRNSLRNTENEVEDVDERLVERRVKVEETLHRPVFEEVSYKRPIWVDLDGGNKVEMAVVADFDDERKAEDQKSLKTIENVLDASYKFEKAIVNPIHYDFSSRISANSLEDINGFKGETVTLEDQRKSLYNIKTVEDVSQKFEVATLNQIRCDVSRTFERPVTENIEFKNAVTVESSPTADAVINEAANSERNNIEFINPVTEIEKTKHDEAKTIEPSSDFDLLQEFILNEQRFGTPYVKEYLFENNLINSLPDNMEQTEESYDEGYIATPPSTSVQYEEVNFQPCNVEDVKYDSSVLQEPFRTSDIDRYPSYIASPTDIKEEDYSQVDSANDSVSYQTSSESNQQYDYNEILKENKYGVVSPMDVRYSYKNVVKEIKTKFPSMENLNESIKNESSEDEEDNLEENPNFMDDFFGVTIRKMTPVFSSSESVDESSSSSSAHRISRGVTKETIYVETNSSKIDQEMQEILEKYLHTRASLIVRSTGAPNIEERETVNKVGNLKKFDNVENLNEIDGNTIEKSVETHIKQFNEAPAEQISDKDEKGDSDVHILDYKAVDVDVKPVLCEIPIVEESESSVIVTEECTEIAKNQEHFKYNEVPIPTILEEENMDIEENHGLTAADTKFIDEMKKKYSQDLDKNEDSEEESKNIDLSTIKFTDEEIEDKFEHLTPEELEIIRTVKKDRFSRPLSDINEVDLALIEEVTKRYFMESNTHEIENAILVEPKHSESPTVEAVNNVVLGDSEVEQSPLSVNIELEVYPAPEKESNFEPVNVIPFNNGFGESRIPRKVLPKPEFQSQTCLKLDDIEKGEEISSMNTDLETGEKSKPIPLFFDRQVTTRHTLIPKPVGKPPVSSNQRRQVKSWTDQFQKRTLDDGISYEPVYANLSFNSLKKTYNDKGVSTKIEKLPLPAPRIRVDDVVDVKNNNGSTLMLPDDTFDVRHDSFVKMTDSEENFSEGTTVIADILVKTEEKILEKTESNASEKSKGLTNNVEPNIEVVPIQTKENVEVTVPVEMSSGSSKDGSSSKQDPSDNEEACSVNRNHPDTSYSTIEVAGKFEQLDLTKIPQGGALGLYSPEDSDIEEISRRSTAEHSNVNLFNLESPAYDESYLNMFQSKEQEVYDKLSGKKRPLKGYFDVNYVEEIFDDDSYEDIPKLQNVNSKPKIVDFVPLDTDTKAYFTKGPVDKSRSSYDTLEREKTFQVLAKASKSQNLLSDTDPESEIKDNSLEVLAKQSSSCSKASSKSVTDTSRSSFSQAKKIFEALVEANNPDGTNKEPAKSNSKTKAQFTVKTSQSSTGSTRKVNIIKSDVNISKPIGETILVVKEGKSVVIDPDKK